MQKKKQLKKNTDFHNHFKKVIARYKQIGYNIIKCFATDFMPSCKFNLG